MTNDFPHTPFLPFSLQKALQIGACFCNRNDLQREREKGSFRGVAYNSIV